MYKWLIADHASSLQSIPWSIHEFLIFCTPYWFVHPPFSGKRCYFSYSNPVVYVKMELLFYCLYSKNTSTVRWCFWCPELRVNMFFSSCSRSYQRADKYLYTVVDRTFEMFDLHTFFFALNKSSIYLYTPHFVEYSVIFVLWSIRTAKIDYFVQIIRNSTVHWEYGHRYWYNV